MTEEQKPNPTPGPDPTTAGPNPPAGDQPDAARDPGPGPGQPARPPDSAPATAAAPDQTPAPGPAPADGGEAPPPAAEAAESPDDAARTPEPAPFLNVVGVKFKRAGKTYFFNAGNLRYNIGDQVIVETDRGLGLGRVVTPVIQLEPKALGDEPKRVIRKANWNDLERDRKNKEREDEAGAMCLDLIHKRGMVMKLVQVEYLHDASKAIFYFTAEQRVDFRELVKDLARQLHTRIEMRQIGVRDEAKICGGIGPCGRPVCCASFLTDFSPVSVRMAKDQNLAMNPAKVSGLCGRLMCCLAYEHVAYLENIKGMPKKGKLMNSTQGPCRVIDLNILARQVLIELESGKTVFASVDELAPPGVTPSGAPPSEDEETAEVNEDILESDDPAALESLTNKNKRTARSAPRTAPRTAPRPAPGPAAAEKPKPPAPKDEPRTARRPDPPPRPREGDRDNRPRPPKGPRPPGRDARPIQAPPGSRPYKSDAPPPKEPPGSRPYQKPARPDDRPPPAPGPAKPDDPERRKKKKRRI